jgi:hypothetical protein
MSFKATLALKTFALTMMWGAVALVIWSGANVLSWVITDGPVVGLLRNVAIIIPAALWGAYWAVVVEELDCTEAFVASQRRR